MFKTSICSSCFMATPIITLDICFKNKTDFSQPFSLFCVKHET